MTKNPTAQRRIWRPLRDAGAALCRDFAALDVDDLPSVLAFVNERGLLGAFQEDSVWDGGGVFNYNYELLWHWRTWQPPVRDALALIDAVNANDVAKLESWIKWEGDTAHLVLRSGPKWQPAPYWHWRTPTDQEYLELEPRYQLRPGNHRQAARVFVAELLNHSLELWVAARTILNPDTGRPELRLRPKNLLGFIWIQIAELAAGSARHRECPGCNRWFEVSLEAKRPDAVCCSPLCRKRLSRRGLLEARRAEGIAKIDEMIAKTQRRLDEAMGSGANSARRTRQKGRRKRSS